MGIAIKGVSYYLPEKCVTNDELLSMISTNSGSDACLDDLQKKLELNLAETRYFRAKNETGVDMAETVARDCLKKAQLDPVDIDFIIYAGMMRDYLEPAMGVTLQGRIGAKNANAFDVMNACNSFLNAVQIAHHFIESGECRNVLIVGSEDGSSHIPWDKFIKGNETSGFSALTVADGAAGWIMQKSSEKTYDKNFKLFESHTYGEHHDLCQIKVGKEADDLKLIVKSKKLAMVAMKVLSDYIPDFIDQAVTYFGDIDRIFFHQITGNPRKVCGRLSDEYYNRAYNSFSRVGNTGTISIPLGMALAEEEGKLKHGDRVAVLVGASGFSCAGTAFVY